MVKMRHKLLILFFLLGTFYLFSYAKVVSPASGLKSVSDSILSEKQEERIVQMKKLFNSVPIDTAAKKVVSLDSHFRDKYLNDQEFNYHQQEEGKSFLKRLFEKIGLLIQKLLGTGSLNKYSDLTSIVFKLLCGLIVLVALYFVIRILLNHKGKWFFNKNDESIVIDINNTEQLIQSADFEQLISVIEKNGDTRQGIRLYYLWLLKDLKDHDLIDWHPEKTNSDYLSELKEETLRKEFSYLSYLYNYIWYGRFLIGDKDYISAKKAFLKYLKGDRLHG